MSKKKVLKEIRDLVESEFGYSIDSKTRERKFIIARAIYFKLAFDNTNCSLAVLGRSLNKHHATVLHALKCFDAYTIQPKLYQHELAIYQSINAELKENPIEQVTLLESIQMEKEEVLKIYKDINKRYMELKQKHNRMLKFYSKYEKKAVKNFVEL